MKIKITKEYLKGERAYPDVIAWFLAQKETDAVTVLKALLAENRLRWANWLVIRVLGRTDRIRYAVFAAEPVVEASEKKYPGRKRSRRMLAAARAVIQNDTEKNRKTARAAGKDAMLARKSAMLVAGLAARVAGLNHDGAGDSAEYVWGAAGWAASWVASVTGLNAEGVPAAGEWGDRKTTREAMERKIILYGVSLLENN